MAADVLITDDGEKDLEEVRSYDARYGTNNYRAVIERLEGLAAGDFTGEGVGVRLRSGRRARKVYAGDFLVYYARGPAGLWVLNVRHGARRSIERK